MRRLIAMFLTTILLFLGACDREEEHLSTAIDFRARLVQAGGCSFEAEILADFGDTAQSFRLACDTDAQGKIQLTILEPETLAGITATVSEGGGRLNYEGLSVMLGSLADNTLAPAAAPGLILESWLSGYILWAGENEGIYQVTYQQELDGVLFQIDTFLKNNLPISAEVCYNNYRVLEMKIEEFQFH